MQVIFRSLMVFCVLVISAAIAASQDGNVSEISIETWPIRNFKIGSDEQRFGPLEFVGGLELKGSTPEFGSISGFRFLAPGQQFVAVTDSGYWLFGAVSHDEAGRPSAFDRVTIQPMNDTEGGAIDSKWSTDAEGLEISEGIATVSFEREHRIAAFTLDPGNMASETGHFDFLVPEYELRRNRGFEAIALAPRDSHLAGAMIAITEKSLDKAGNIFASILSGPQKGIFKVRRDDTFDVTDAVFLPDGDLLLLERSFTMAEGVKMRLRRITLGDINKDATVDGPVLMEADLHYQIDNMEGMDVWVDPDGAKRLSLISDDNQSILQRNLYLEFRFIE